MKVNYENNLFCLLIRKFKYNQQYKIPKNLRTVKTPIIMAGNQGPW